MGRIRYNKDVLKGIEENCEILFSVDMSNITLDKETIESCIICLSAYYGIKKDNRCLKCLEKLAMNPSVSLEKKALIYWQLSTIQFRNISETNVNLRELYEVEVGQVYRESKMVSMPYLTNIEKNKGAMVFLTTQFIGIQHSPTKLLLKLIKTIDDYFENIKEIYIFNSGELPGENDDKFINGFVANYIEFDAERFRSLIKQVGIGRCNIQYGSVGSGQVSSDKLDKLAKMVYKIKPKYVFSIGGSSLLAEICNTFTDVFTWPLSKELPITNTRYIIETSNTSKVEAIDLNSKQTLLKIPLVLNVFDNVQKKKYSREEEGLKEEFLISVVGNRLSSDVTDEFLELCMKVVENHDNVGIVFIGMYDREEYESKIKEPFRSRFYNIGYKSDLVSALQLTNVYLNPKRSGGGLSCVAAMKAGIPVISIDFGDVTAYLNETFKMQNYDEVYEKLSELIKDKESYQKACHDTIEWCDKFKEDGNKILFKYLEENM